MSYAGITERARVSAAISYASQLKHRGLVDAQGFWSFDECSGTTVSNSAGSSSGSTSPATGTLSWSSDTPAGTGCSLSFNGSLFIDTGVTLSNEYYRKSAWVKTTGSGNIVSDTPPAANSAFYVSSGRVSAGHNGSWNALQSSPVNDGKWHFVTVEFTRNGTSSTGTMVVTVDGTVAASNTSIPLMTNPTPITQSIGAYNNSNYFSGLMDDVMVITK